MKIILGCVLFAAAWTWLIALALTNPDMTGRRLFMTYPWHYAGAVALGAAAGVLFKIAGRRR